MSNENALPESVPAQRRQGGGVFFLGPQLRPWSEDIEGTGGFFQAIDWKPPELCRCPDLDSRQLFFMKLIKFFFQIACYAFDTIPRSRGNTEVTFLLATG